MKNILFYITIAIGVSGCLGSDAITPNEQLEIDIDKVDKDQLARDIEALDAYLDSAGIDAIEHPTGLRYVIDPQGSGPQPDLADFITVNYKGFFLTPEATVFQERDDISFSLTEVIVGWRIGIPLIQQGGTAVLYIPSGYAYGPFGSPDGSIPPDTNIAFEVDLLNVVRD